MSLGPEKTQREVSKIAVCCLRRTGFSVAGWVLMLVNFPIFLTSDVVGEVEFALPTVPVEATIVSVDSFGPFHHRSTFSYETPLGRMYESSWSSSRPNLEPGQLARAEHQESDLEHAKIVDQRKGPIAAWQTAILPSVAIVFFLIGAWVGRRRVRLARTGELAQATPDGNELVFEVVQSVAQVGYRDHGSERRSFRIPIPTTMPEAERQKEQAVIYSADRPNQTLLLIAQGLRLKDEKIEAFRKRPNLAWALIPYVGFSFMLLSYYLANA